MGDRLIQIGKFLNRHALALAIVVGAIGYPLFSEWTAALPPLIFLMLFFTFCKVNPLDLRLHPWHGIALAVQLMLAFAAYWLLHVCPWMWGDQEIVAQSVMLCLIMPTATAAPIVAGKLGGSIQNLTTFTILSNIATAIVVPLFFPVVHPMPDVTFLPAMLMILRKVGPLLFGPFIAAWLLRLCYDGVQHHKGSTKRFNLSRNWAQLPFYIWTGTIVILMGDMTRTLVEGSYHLSTLLLVFVGTTITCFLQFFLGWKIGCRWPAGGRGISRVTAGQAFGQKNTTLAIWMAQTYLLPLTALAPAIYMIVQNLFNSWQLSQAAKVAPATFK